MRKVALVVAVLMMLGAPASAGTQESPELSDTCGVGLHAAQEQVLPWLDLCAGWFESESASGVPEITVNLEVADLAANRTDSQYWGSWTAGGCDFTVIRSDGGAQLAPSDAASILSVQCNTAREVPCETPWKELGFFCWEIDEPEQFDVSDTFSESGNTLSWTLRFEGDLAPYASAHSDGSVLTATSAMTAVGVNSVGIIGPNNCTRYGDEPWECSNQVSDWINEGRDYVVGS